MSNILFKLREPHSRKATTIHVYYYYDGKRFVASVRRKINPKDWDSKRQRPKRSAQSAESLTAYLNSIQSAIIDRHNYLLAIGRYPSNQEFRQAISERSGRLSIGRPNLYQRLEEECENASPRSVYHRLRKQVKLFVSARRMPVQMDAINEEWFNDFQAFLIANNAESYAYRIAKQFKTVIRHTKFDWEGKAAVLAAKSKASGTPSEKVFLNFGELQRLHSAKLQSSELNEVRQMLYLACITGLRISDWHKYQLGGDVVEVGQYKFIRIVMQKLKKQRGIKVAYPPLLPSAEKILKGFGGAFLPERWRLLSENEGQRVLFNRAAKEAARRCGFTEQVTLLKKSKGETVSATAPKYAEISSKVGRNSFVSNFRSIGAPDVLLNLMTGHSGQKNIADAYDVASFEAKAPLLFGYLETFQEKLNGGEIRLSFF